MKTHSGSSEGYRFEKGEVLLAFGTIAVVICIALIYFVMGIFLAVVPGSLALLFLITGVLKARNSSAPVSKQLVGILLLVAGFSILAVVGFYTCQLSYDLAFHRLRPSKPPPGLVEWIQAIFTWLIPIVFIVPGLAFWTNWSAKRRRVWCLSAFLVPPAIVGTHQILAALGGPLTA